MAISLYTSRVVLATLGEEDYGIYNVVGGVVAMFGFINAAMTTGTQRYLTFELGTGNFQNLQKVFCTSIIIHASISLLVFILAETIGLWFLYYKMTIPEIRMNAAFWVYQFSIVSTIVMIMSVPYNAAIIAHEKMSAFAFISILEAVLRLVIVYLLLIVDWDKLILYALLGVMLQIGIRIVYGIYCKKHFRETELHWVWDKKLIREMLGFAGWNLWGNCAYVAFTQGLNILLNLFFGPKINAARGVAVQVQNAISMFAANFQTAVNPQITKSYAVGDYSYMHSLIFRSSKFTFFLLFLLSLPVMLEADTILNIWLKSVPEYTVVFLRLILCVTIIDAVANPLMVAASATGRVKVYQGVVGGILLSILPISYVVLKLGGEPASVFIVHIFICILAFIVRLFIIRPLIALSLRKFCEQVVFPCLIVAIPSVALSLGVKEWLFISSGVFSSLLMCAVSVVIGFICIYFLGLNISERKFVNEKINFVLHRFKR